MQCKSKCDYIYSLYVRVCVRVCVCVCCNAVPCCLNVVCRVQEKCFLCIICCSIYMFSSNRGAGGFKTAGSVRFWYDFFFLPNSQLKEHFCSILPLIV